MMTLRWTHLLLAMLTGFALQAQQQYYVHLSGHHTPCTSDLQDSVVTIVTLPGTVPMYDIEVPINENCYYTVTLEVNSPDYGFVITSGCNPLETATVLDTNIVVPPGTTLELVNDFICPSDPPTCQSDFTFQQQMIDGELVPFTMETTNLSTGTPPLVYTWYMPDGSFNNEESPTFVFDSPVAHGLCLHIADADGCSSVMCDTVYVSIDGVISDFVVPDCLGEPGGTDLPGTPCFDEDTNTMGTWNANCDCIPDPEPDCEAGFWVIQAYEMVDPNDTTIVEPIPYTLWVWNLSSGGSGAFSFTWDFGDGTTSTESFPTHVYADSGPYELCLTVLDDEGCTDTYCEEVSVDEDGYLGFTPGGLVRSALTINVIQSLPTGIAEQPSLEAHNLWPNPAKEQVDLMLNSSRSGTLDLSIMDIHGREVQRSTIGVQAGRNQLTLNVGALDQGTYIIRLVNGSDAAALRFIKH